MAETTFKISLSMSLKDIKRAYNNHLGYPKGSKVTKQDLAGWIASMAEADVQDIFTEIDDAD
jgi:hypothetical protein